MHYPKRLTKQDDDVHLFNWFSLMEHELANNLFKTLERMMFNWFSRVLLINRFS